MMHIPKVTPAPPRTARRALAMGFTVCLTLAALGCGTAPAVAPDPTPTAQATEPKRPSVPVTSRVIGYSVKGQPILAHRLGDAGPVTMVLAGVHGSEPAGVPLSRRLMLELMAKPQWMHGRSVVFVHEANPDGLRDGKRGNSRGVDLNRNFPSANFKDRKRYGNSPLSQPEAQAMHDVILATDPDRILTLHQPLDCLDYDGPAESLARFMAEYTDLPVKKLGSRPGSLGSWAGVEAGRAVVTVEFRKGEEKMSDEALWDRYGTMMLAGITYPHPPPTQ